MKCFQNPSYWMNGSASSCFYFACLNNFVFIFLFFYLSNFFWGYRHRKGQKGKGKCQLQCQFLTYFYKYCIGNSREIAIVENLWLLVRLLDLTADFGVKTNAKFSPIFKLRKESKTGIQSCLYTVTLIPFFCVNFLIYIFSNVQFL